MCSNIAGREELEVRRKGDKATISEFEDLLRDKDRAREVASR